MAPIALSDISPELPTATLSTSQQIPLGEYLFKRIQSLGINSIFGVPGDFNLNLLEHLYSTDLNWFGNCNELNAAYSADGYSRSIKGGDKFGVVITTFGVGELSAMNGISGSFAEYVPILHVVGTTSNEVKQTGENIHHLIPNIDSTKPSNHYIYEKMAESVSCKVESIKDLNNATDKIDLLIKEIIKQKRPGYLYLPCDLVDRLVSDSNLSHPISEFKIESIVNDDESVTDEITNLVLDKLYNSSNPCILGDVLTDRFNKTENLRQFITKSNIPNLSTFMGKSILDETNESYIGDFNGRESTIEVQEFIKSSDLVIHVGNYYNEINSGHNTIYKNISIENELVLLNNNYIQIGSKKIYKDVNFINILPKLLEQFDVYKYQSTQKKSELPSKFNSPIQEIKSSLPISQTTVLQNLQTFLKPNDTIVVDTGSLMFGLPDLRFPKSTKLVGQHFYLSIGMGLPCSFGVSVALSENSRVHNDHNGNDGGRLILIEGDGAAQMTIQELSNFNRPNELVTKPLILLLNNSGYTVERVIKGPTRDYNDVRPDWRWSSSGSEAGMDGLLDVLGFDDCASVKVEQPGELELVLNEYGARDARNKMRLIEVILDKMDVPWRFKYMCGLE